MYITLAHPRLDEDFFPFSSSRLTTLNPYTKGKNLDSVLVYINTFFHPSLSSFVTTEKSMTQNCGTTQSVEYKTATKQI